MARRGPGERPSSPRKDGSRAKAPAARLARRADPAPRSIRGRRNASAAALAILVASGPARAAALDPPQALPSDVWGRFKAGLAADGVDVAAVATFDLLGNATGGTRRGATLEDGVELSLKADLGALAGLPGATFKVDGYGVFGQGLSARNIDNYNLVSSIEALRSVWLYELWLQQAFADGRADLRVGQLGADSEFLITRYGAWLVNTAWGWPTLPSVDLPAGGPNYPLATPGARLRWRPSDRLTLLAAAFNGDPAGSGLDNPQRRDPHGTLFRLGDGVFAIAEAQYAAAGGATTVKLGAWYHDKARSNAFFANDGLTVSTPTNVARQDASAYGVVDALLVPGSGGWGGLAGFARASVAPFARSEIGAEVCGGLVALDPFGRAGDKAGLGVTAIRVGQPVGTDGLVRFAFRGTEAVIEASYLVTLSGGVTLQPDVQYVVNPGGGIPNPIQPSRTTGSAAVFGLRAIASF